MLFNSLEFGIFFTLVFIVYFTIPRKFQWVLLLITSYYFYMSYKPELVVLILICTIVNYGCALLIDKYRVNRGLFLGISLFVSLGLLCFFKYFNFFNNAISDMLRIISIDFSPIELSILLPMGISFYTLQSLSYTIDVYRGTIKAERHFGYFALFVSFFPQLVAGPIERANELLPQLKQSHSFDYENASWGIKLMAWGFFKKLVIADNLARYVDLVYNDVQSYSGFALIFATILFSIQIYCDFSGYSDIARGAAKMMGFDLTVNFKAPYLATNIADFWRRWHVTLTNWFRDYVYIPIGGKKRYLRNTLVVFGISGLWHGANYTFIVWGLLNAIGIIGYKYYRKIVKKKETNSIIKMILSIAVTFAIASFCWIFFRSNNISDSIYIIENMFVGISAFPSYIINGLLDIGITKYHLAVTVVSILILFVFDFINSGDKGITRISSLNKSIRWVIYIMLILLIVFLAPKNAPAEFIYFEF